MIATILHIGWRSACIGYLVATFGLRTLRYTPIPWSAEGDARLGEAMVQVGNLFIWPWALTSLNALDLAIALSLLLLLLRRRLLAREAGRWRFRPLLLSLLCAGAAWAHYVFDLTPSITLPAFTLLALLLPLLCDAQDRKLPRAGPATPVLWACFAAVALLSVLACHDFADRISLAGWAASLAAAVRWGPRWLPTRELRISMLLALIPLNFAPTLIPLVLPLHGGTRVGEGFAYDYCELPHRRLLAVSVPGCSSIPSTRDGFSACRDGSVRFYDSESLRLKERRHFFSDAYYGRLEQLLCVGDDIYVGMQGTHFGDEVEGAQSAMHFRFDSPEAFQPLVAGVGLGTSIAYDPTHDALLFTGEFTGDIARLDRASGGLTLHESLRRPWVHPVMRVLHSGSLATGVLAVDAQHDRFFVWEWMQGRHAHAVDLNSFEPLARYDAYSGSILGGSVDVDRKRLILSSLWGIEVFDLETQALLLRKRMGFTNRPAVIDRWRDRIYISSSVDGKVRVLDRDSFEVIDQIAVGIGPRYLHLASDGSRLFASSLRAHYAWDLPPIEEDP